MKVIDDGKIILKMVDGGLVDYSDDTRHTPGCPTCDYGSQYINDIDIDLKRHSVHIKINQMYDYALSEGKMMILPGDTTRAIRILTSDIPINR